MPCRAPLLVIGLLLPLDLIAVDYLLPFDIFLCSETASIMFAFAMAST